MVVSILSNVFLYLQFISEFSHIIIIMEMFRVEYAHFQNIFFATFHASMTITSIYYRYVSIAESLTTLQIIRNNFILYFV